MLNSKPNNKKYHQGNFIPVNKDKVYKMNNQGGVFYRSSWEYKIMKWLDMNESIVIWGAECFEIPYEMTHFEAGDFKIKNHRYYPDFFYKMKMSDGSIKEVVAEVKPQKEYQIVLDLIQGRLSVPKDGNLKKLKSFEYELKLGQKNRDKWETMISWCNLKGYEFIIITELHLKKFGM